MIKLFTVFIFAALQAVSMPSMANILPPGPQFEDIEVQMNKWVEEELAIKLDQNQPNPFQNLTEIQYFLSKPGHARLSIFDMNGKEIARLIDKNVKASWSTLIINGSGLTNGPYLLKLESEGKTAIKHLL